MGATFGAFRTLLLFTDLNRRLEQLAVSASLEYRVAERITLSGAAGVMIMGTLGGVPTQPGGVGSLALSFLVLEQGEYTPFLQFSASIAVSAMRAADSNYVAIDFRGGLAAGWTLFERFTPYAVVRAFGGPVFYGSAIGTDAYHVQLGAGFVVGLPLGLDLSAEIIPLGEQRVTAGLGVSF